MLHYEKDSIDKFLIDLHNIGLTVNEEKGKGKEFVTIESYEDLLDTLITMTHNYQELEDHHESYSRRIGEVLGVYDN